MKANKRKLALLLGAAMAVMAFAAPGASAATEVFDAQTEELCAEVEPAVSVGPNVFYWIGETHHDYQSGGCTVSVSGAGYVAYLNGGATNSCDASFDAHVGPDGWGYVDNVQFSNCTLAPAEACQGDRFIAPAEYNPNNTFKYADTSTDLNAALCAYMPLSGQKYWGNVSFDLYQLDASTQLWDNQQTDGPHGSWYYHVADYWSDSAEDQLIVTH